MGSHESPGPSAQPTAIDVFRFVAWLEVQGAANDFVEWVKTRNLGWPDAWTACPRGDWLLAVAARADAPRADLLRATVAVAALVEEDLATPGLAEAVLELKLAVESGSLPPGLLERVDQSADRSGDLAESLGWRAVALAARSFLDAQAAALVPSQVAELAMASVLDCGMMSALGATLARTADVVRANMPPPPLPASRASRP